MRLREFLPSSTDDGDCIVGNDDQLGYRAVNVWPEATPENAQIVAINPELQERAEEILWSLRQDRPARAA